MPLGGGLIWPASLEFTHIDENHRLSPALTTAFLPRRRIILEALINARCGATTGRLAGEVDLGPAAIAAAIADGRTVGGSPVGAPN